MPWRLTYLSLLAIGLLSGCAAERATQNPAPVDADSPTETQLQGQQQSTQADELNQQDPKIRYQYNQAGGSSPQEEDAAGIDRPGQNP